MQFKLVIKTPDLLDSTSIRDAAEEECRRRNLEWERYDESDRERIIGEEVRKICAYLKRWVRYSEYVEIEIDTQADTAEVVRQG